MSNNHLILGLGGTGGKTIKNLKKAIFEEFRCNDPNQSTFRPDELIYIKYLYIDSNRGDMQACERWRTHGDMGSDISLSKESLISISQNNLAIRLDDPQNYPITHQYVGKREDWKEIFSSMNINETAGGQIRRLGVALFEPECANFRDHLLNIVEQLQTTSNKSGTKFHVCCGLAGGTGSGAFLHVIAQLRANYPDASLYPIYLYLLLPEENSPWAANGDKTNYYANGYAALLELNAYLVSDSSETPRKGGPLFAPVDLTGQSQRFTNPSMGGTSRLKDRLQGCFVLNTVNEKNIKMPVEEITQLFAQLLFQRLFLLDSTTAHLPQELKTAISLENLSIPDEAKLSDSNCKLRSVRLQTFGVKKIVIPDEEIREHLAACFAEQSLLQMLYNHWLAGDTRFRTEAKNQVFTTFLQNDAHKRPWKLSNSQITLSEGILESELALNWSDIGLEWLQIANTVKMEAWQQAKSVDKDDRLDKLQAALGKHFLKTFRSIGVEAFYKSKQDDLGRENTHIAEISDSVQEWMYRQWLEGEYGFVNLLLMLNDLIDDIKSRHDKVGERLKQIELRLHELEPAIAKNNETWGNLGFLSQWLGKREALFDAQCECLREYYELQTWSYAWRFAEKLLYLTLLDLRDKVLPIFQDFKRSLEDALVFFNKTRASTCRLQEANDMQQHLIKFYEPSRVQELARVLLSSENKQKSWAQRSRTELNALAESNKTEVRSKAKYFGSLLLHSVLINTLERIARTNSLAAHDDETTPSSRVINANIVSRLASQFHDPEKLRDFVRNILDSSLTYMRFNQSEIVSSPNAVQAVILPRCEEYSQFREQLSQLFMNNQTPGIRLCIIDSSRAINQITLICFKYGFPLRYLQPVQFLREKYDQRILQNPSRVKLEVHIEDHPEGRLPDLYRPRSDQMGKQILPWYQLAVACALLTRQIPGDTNRTIWCLETKDVNNLPEYHYYPDELVTLLGDDECSQDLSSSQLLDILYAASDEQCAYLEKAVVTELSTQSYQLASQRETLKLKLHAQLKRVLLQRNSNTQDAFYMLLLESSKTALNRIDART